MQRVRGRGAKLMQSRRWCRGAGALVLHRCTSAGAVQRTDVVQKWCLRAVQRCCRGAK